MDDEDEILDLLSNIDTRLDLKAEVAFLERKESNAKNNNNSNDKSSGKNKGKQSNGGEKGKSKDEKFKPCYKHDGEHDYRDCPENKNRRPQPQSESKKEKEKVPKKDLHSTKKETEQKKTPMVKIVDQSEINNRYKDLAYDTDEDGSIMMLSANNKQVLNAADDDGSDTDWRNILTRNGTTQNHTLALGGGEKKFNYRASLNFISQDGIVIKSNFKNHFKSFF